MRTPLAVMLATATACAVAVGAGSAGSAQALGSLPVPTVIRCPRCR